MIYSVDVSSSGDSSTLTIKLSDIGFILDDMAEWTYLSLMGGTTEGTVTYKSYYDPFNAIFGTTNTLAEFTTD